MDEKITRRLKFTTGQNAAVDELLEATGRKFSVTVRDEIGKLCRVYGIDFPDDMPTRGGNMRIKKTLT